MGLERDLVAREPHSQHQLRGIGQDAGQGQRLTHDIWLSRAVAGESVVDWEAETLTPMGGYYGALRVEGWFTVLEQMSVPMIIGSDLLEEYDVMVRPRSRQIVLEGTSDKSKRVAVKMFTLGSLIDEVRARHEDRYLSPVWQQMAKDVRCANQDLARTFYINRAVVPPGTMKATKLRYPKTVAKWMALASLRCR